jgi:putative hemolysin
MLGYEYDVVETDLGEAGVCTFPDGISCDEWEFLAGLCGEEYSYCVQNGYGIETVSDGKDPYLSEYAVCVDDQGNVIGSVTELAKLHE